MFKNLRKYDISIILFNIVLACLIFVAFSSESGNVVRISVAGKEYGTYSLFEDENILVSTEKGDLYVVIHNSRVYVKDSECSDKECLKQGNIHRKGQSVICLPLETVIEIGEDNYELAF